MSEIVSSHERRKEYIDRIGPTAGPLFSPLYNDFVYVNYEWRIFSEWFRANKERVELLNSVSAGTTFVLQNALRERVIIKICRFLDPAAQGKRKNATLEALIEATPGAQKFSEHLREIRFYAEGMRSMRNTSLAHRDIRHATFEREFHAVSYSQIDKTLKGVGKLIKEYSIEYLDRHLVFNLTTPFASDEVAFLHILDLGIREWNRRLQEMDNLENKRAYREITDLLERPSWLRSRDFDVFE